jgi:hypothetical protein
VITNLHLPPGKYEIVAWHEKFGEKTLAYRSAENSKMELNIRVCRQQRQSEN